TKCTLRLADRFSNSVDIGTQVSFRTEAGRVNATDVVSVMTGTVTATLDSASPRPTYFLTSAGAVTQLHGVPLHFTHNPARPFPDGTEAVPGFPSVFYTESLLQKVGRVRLIGITQGEESFIDANGNKIYDPGEVFVDLPEPFVDKNGG